MLSREQLQRAAADSGFLVESYEKAHVLVRLLGAVRTHPFLGPRMALKGGTARPRATPVRSGERGPPGSWFSTSTSSPPESSPPSSRAARAAMSSTPESCFAATAWTPRSSGLDSSSTAA